MFLISILFLNSAFAENHHNCPSVSNEITFQPSGDDQYELKWCRDRLSNAHNWNIKVYHANRSDVMNAKTCKGTKYLRNTVKLFPLHSQYGNEYLVKTKPKAGCPQVCYTQTIYFIGNGCFYIKIYEGNGKLYAQSYYYVGNTKHQSIYDFKKRHESNVYTVSIESNMMSVNWQFNDTPIFNYKFLMKNSSEEYSKGIDYTRNCTVQPERQGIKCTLMVPPGCYQLLFQNKVPFTFLGGILHYNITECHNVDKALGAAAAVPVPSAGGAGAWWAAGALLALALLVAGALLLRRRRLALEDGKRITEAWRTYWMKGRGMQRRVEGGEGACSVLLLYARDCEPAAERAVTALKQLLQHAVTGQVYDLFSPECACAWSASPREWVSALVRREDVRVVLLHTPAAALYDARLTDEHQLESGVMGRAVAYSDPQYGDALVAFALQLVRAAAAESSDPFCHPHHSHSHYRKYFIAHVSGLTDEDVELARGVAPYTRYLLPDAAPLLLRDVAAERDCTGRASPPAESPPHLLAELEGALRELTAHAQRHPNYLTDHLQSLHNVA